MDPYHHSFVGSDRRKLHNEELHSLQGTQGKNWQGMQHAWGEEEYM
jgi:hypothetical protein